MADGTSAVAGDAGGTATTDAGATAAASTAAPATGAGTVAVAAAEAPWYGELDSDTIGWLQNKQYFGTDIAKADVRKSFPEFVKATRSMERLVGDPNSRVIIPKEGDAEGWNAFYAKVGRPADAAGYELKAPEGGDQTLTDSIASIAHKFGLTKSQVHGILPELSARANEVKAAQNAAAEQSYINNSTAEVESLRNEWGNGADARFAAAQRASKAFGLDPAKMDKMERAIGTKDFLTFMAGIGAAVSEDGGSGHGNQAFSAMTPEAARAWLKDKQNDAEFAKRLQAGDADAVAEKRRVDETLAAAMG